MSNETHITCDCGAGPPRVESDDATLVTFIECLSCSYIVGATKRSEAVLMWNGAMFALAGIKR